MKKALYILLTLSISSNYIFSNLEPEYAEKTKEKYSYNEQEIKELEKDIERLQEALKNFDTQLPKFRRKE